MNDVMTRLVNCFKAVFPDLSDAEITRASLTSVTDWDSVASVALITVVEEEFGLQFPAEEMENLTSFALILNQLQRETHVA